jgi:hypothetical protein
MANARCLIAIAAVPYMTEREFYNGHVCTIIGHSFGYSAISPFRPNTCKIALADRYLMSAIEEPAGKYRLFFLVLFFLLIPPRSIQGRQLRRQVAS